MLAGFYVFAGAIIAGLIWLGVLLGSPKLFIVTLFAAAAMVVAFWKVLRTKPELPDGVRVERSHAPELWASIEELAKKVGTRAPDEIQLIPEVNAAVTEDAKWLGIVGGRRYLLIGTPLLQTFTVDQLRAVLAHELGHYSNNHTRLGALSYRGRMMIVNTVQRLDGIISWLMLGYARVYILVESSVSRRQEFEADLASARLAGKGALASALGELPVLGQAWGFYLDRYVAYGLDSGYAPAGIIRSFPELFAARQKELDEMRRSPKPEEHSRWDSHPPIATRIAVIAKQPDVAIVADGRPAMALIPAAETYFEQLEQKFNFGTRQRVPFAEFTSHAQQANSQFAADHLYRAAGRLASDPQPGLRTVLTVLQTGRHPELLAALGKESLEVSVQAAIANVAVRSGAASWRLSWTEAIDLVAADGTSFPYEELAKPIAAGDLAGTQGTLEKLVALGIDLGTAQAVHTSATADRAEVIGAMVNMKINGDRKDLLVLDTGLIIVPGAARLKMGGAKKRLAELAQLPPAQLIAQAGHQYLPYEEMRQVRTSRVIRKTYEITMHNGSVVRIKHGGETEDLATNNAFGQVMANVMNR
jgi:Zn-dependent protease with chaperone function